MTDQPLQLAVSLEVFPSFIDQAGPWVFDDKSGLADRIRRLILHHDGNPGCEKHQRWTKSK